jgi:hypothetical protein
MGKVSCRCAGCNQRRTCNVCSYYCGGSHNDFYAPPPVVEPVAEVVVVVEAPVEPAPAVEAPVEPTPAPVEAPVEPAPAVEAPLNLLPHL